VKRCSNGWRNMTPSAHGWRMAVRLVAQWFADDVAAVTGAGGAVF
jgi:hypothetical protein